jgi:hypothetical protein
MEAVEIAGAGEEAIPLAGRLAGDLADNEVGQGIDAPARAAAEEGFRTDMELELDERVSGRGDEQEIGEEPEDDFCGERGREKSEIRNSKFEGFGGRWRAL